MNYLAEILAFNNWIEFNSNINKSDICLWHALMSIANRFRWKEFNAPIQTLIAESKLTKNDIYKSRNKLKQFGLIDFKERSGNQASIYSVKSIASLYGTQNDTQSMTQSGTQNRIQSDTQSVNIHKTKNQKLKTKNKESISTDVDIPKKVPYGNFSHVHLTEQEHSKLISEYGDIAPELIQHLDDWIEMKGPYKAKSHYLAIKKWVITAFNDQKLKEKAQKLKEKELEDRENKQKYGGNNYGQNRSNNQQYPAYVEGKINRSGEPWCTEYPE